MLSDKANKALELYNRTGLYYTAYKAIRHYSPNDEFIDNVDRYLSVQRLQARMKDENNIEDILDTVFEHDVGLGDYFLQVSQLREEIKQLAEIVSTQSPSTIMEIGTSNGGTLYIWCRHIQSASKIISLDLPGGDFGGGYPQKKEKLYNAFAPDKELKFLRANSHNKSTREKINQNILNESEPIDFLFIDADHTYDGVKTDFEMYSDLVSSNGMIAFHDIVHHPDDESVVNRRKENTNIDGRHFRGGAHPDVRVHQFWNEIKESYESKEIISHDKQTWAGIGILYL